MGDIRLEQEDAEQIEKALTESRPFMIDRRHIDAALSLLAAARERRETELADWNDIAHEFVYDTLKGTEFDLDAISDRLASHIRHRLRNGPEAYI